MQRLAFFFFNDTATTEIYTLSLHDALPICALEQVRHPAGELDDLLAARHLAQRVRQHLAVLRGDDRGELLFARSEEHTSELQSRQYLVCRLLLEKKKNKKPH